MGDSETGIVVNGICQHDLFAPKPPKYLPAILLHAHYGKSLLCNFVDSIFNSIFKFKFIRLGAEWTFAHEAGHCLGGRHTIQQAKAEGCKLYISANEEIENTTIAFTCSNNNTQHLICRLDIFETFQGTIKIAQITHIVLQRQSIEQ